MPALKEKSSLAEYLGGVNARDIHIHLGDKELVDGEGLSPTPPEESHYRLSDNTETSCVTCSHFTEGTCDLYNALVTGDMVCDSHKPDAGVNMGEETPMDQYKLSELFFAGGGVSQDVQNDNSHIWKTVLKTGTWALTPGEGQKAVDKPLTVVRENPATGEIALSDILSSFDDGAFEHVTVPLSHADKVDENTGFVRQLRIVDDEDGASRLQAAFDFTEPSIKEKVLNGSIANTSVGLMFDRLRTVDAKKFKTAMYHVALTNRPWISGMEPFSALAASEDVASLQLEAPSAEVEVAAPVEPVMTEPVDEPVEPVTAEEVGAAIEAAPVAIQASEIFEPNDLQRAQQAREVRANNGAPRGGEVKLSDTQTTDQRLELSEDAKQLFESMNGRLAQAEAENRSFRVDRRIDELSDMGLSEYPGFLKEIRDVMLADDGGTALLLSEEVEGETKEVKLTATNIIDRLVEALPKEGDKIVLSQQITDETGKGRTQRPPADASDERPQHEKTLQAAEYLGDTSAMKTFPKGGE